MTPIFSVSDQLRTEDPPDARRTGLRWDGGGSGGPPRAADHRARCRRQREFGRAVLGINRDPPGLRIVGAADGQSSNGPLSPCLEVQDKTAKQAAFWIDGYLWRNGLPLALPGHHELTAYAQDAGGQLQPPAKHLHHRGQPDPRQATGHGGARPVIARRFPPSPRQDGPLDSQSDEGGKPSSWPPGMARFVFVWWRRARRRSGSPPRKFGRSNGAAPPSLTLQYLDLDGDGVIEVAAEGPGPDGRRLVLVRWQAGDWWVIGDFAGEDLLLLGGPTGARRPGGGGPQGQRGQCLGEDKLAVGPWARVQSRDGGSIPGGRGCPARGSRLCLSPAVPLDGEPRRGFNPHLPGRSWPIRRGPAGRKEGYRLVTLRDEGVIPVTAEAVAGEIGPTWRWPDPDGLFTADFDGDGAAEPYLTVRQGREWRELLVYDVDGGGIRQVFRGRARLSTAGYDSGLGFTRRGEEALIRLGQGAETRLFRWDRAGGGFQPITEEPDGPPRNLLGRILSQGGCSGRYVVTGIGGFFTSLLVLLR